MHSSLLANAGIPMIVFQFPAMLLALLPVILIESLIARWCLWSTYPRAYARVYGGVALANVISTVIGVPLA